MGKPFKKIQPPKDQSFTGGISITCRTARGFETARFKTGAELAEWYEQNHVERKK